MSTTTSTVSAPHQSAAGDDELRAGALRSFETSLNKLVESSDAAGREPSLLEQLADACASSTGSGSGGGSGATSKSPANDSALQLMHEVERVARNAHEIAHGSRLRGSQHLDIGTVTHAFKAWGVHVTAGVTRNEPEFDVDHVSERAEDVRFLVWRIEELLRPTRYKEISVPCKACGETRMSSGAYALRSPVESGAGLVVECQACRTRVSGVDALRLYAPTEMLSRLNALLEDGGSFEEFALTA